jgi:hypothetical protein
MRISVLAALAAVVVFDDAFIEKASVTWYFHNGKWLRLQSSD